MTGASLGPRSSAAPKATIAQAVPKNDLAIVRAAQGSTSLPRSFNQPQAPPPLSVPGLLAPNMSSEAEQVGRILTGQPLNARLGSPPPAFARFHPRKYPYRTRRADDDKSSHYRQLGRGQADRGHARPPWSFSPRSPT